MTEVAVTTLLELQYTQSCSQIVTTNKPTPDIVTGRMPFLSPNQQCQSAGGRESSISVKKKLHNVPCILTAVFIFLAFYCTNTTYSIYNNNYYSVRDGQQYRPL